MIIYYIPAMSLIESNPELKHLMAREFNSPMAEYMRLLEEVLVPSNARVKCVSLLCDIHIFSRLSTV